MLETCPSREELSAYFFGKLAPKSMEQTDMHFTGCVRCQAVADSVEQLPDPLLQRLRRLKSHRPLPRDAQLSGIMARALAAALNPPPQEEPAIPARMGPYLILSKLGQGGMGAVYKAQHPTLDRLVAIKTITAEFVKNSDALARFDREIKTLTLLDHPNIARIYDRGENEGLPFFVMEYVEGHTLKDLLKHWGKISLAEACELAYQTAQGLHEIHNAHVVHRDIKPGNLILGVKGLKILDVGLARWSTPEGDTHLTSNDRGMGTPLYMAPEQFENAKTVGTRADIFSLGRTLCHLLAGELPSQNLVVIDDQTPDPLSHIPKELKAVIQKMLSKRPEQRQGSAAELATQLEPFRLGANLQRLLAAPMRPGAIATTADFAPTAVGAAESTVPDSRRRRPWRWVAAMLAAIALGSAAVYGLLGPMLTIETPKGTLKIEFPNGIPGNAQIFVNGTKVRLKRIDGNNGEVVLDAGDSDVTVRDGDKVLRQEKVTIRRNRLVLLTVEVQPRREVAQEGKNGAPAESDQKPVEISNMSGFKERYPVSVRFSSNYRFALTSESHNNRSDYRECSRLWDLRKSKLLSSWGYYHRYAEFTADGRLVASASGRQMDFSDPITGKVIGAFKMEFGNAIPSDFSFSTDGKSFLVAGMGNGFVRVWDFPAGKLYREFKHGSSAATACFTVDQRLILSGGNDNIVRLWDIEQDRQEKTYEGHDRRVWLVRPLADGKRFVSISEDGRAGLSVPDEGKIIVWDLKTGVPLQKLHLEKVNLVGTAGKSLAVAPEASRLLVGHTDGSITFWDLAKGEKAGQLDGHKKGAVTAVDITPDGCFALSVGEDMTLRYWRLPIPSRAVGQLGKAIEKE